METLSFSRLKDDLHTRETFSNFISVEIHSVGLAARVALRRAVSASSSSTLVRSASISKFAAILRAKDTL